MAVLLHTLYLCADSIVVDRLTNPEG